MQDNELRKDYLLNRWVVIAKNRKKRPTDFVKNHLLKKEGICPLCPGNESMTPPAVLVYLPVDGEVIKEKDLDGFRHKDWLLRVVPNLYPVFASSIQKNALIQENLELKGAVGQHELIIETQNHHEQPSKARVLQLVHVINAYLDRLAELSKKSYVKYISIFRNYKPEAGASLSHPHSQLITTPFVPTIPKEELKTSKRYWNKNGECLICNILKQETLGPRFIWENISFVVFAPWASVNPLEFWIAPKHHQSNMLNMLDCEVNDLAEALRVCLGGLQSLVNDPPYNFGFHTIPSQDAKDYYHWHLEVYPKLAAWAGFEKNTGMFINMIPPEDAATELRATVHAQKKTLQ